MTTYNDVIKNQPKGTRYCANCRAYAKPMLLYPGSTMKVCPTCERGPLVMTPKEAAKEENE